MKKILLLSVFCVLFLSGFAVYAQNDLVYVDMEPLKFPQTYTNQEIALPTQSIELFSTTEPSFETVIKGGWDILSESILISQYNLSVEELEYMYRSLVYSEPKNYYYVSNGCRYSYNQSTGIVIRVYPNYNETDMSVISEFKNNIDMATEEIMMHLSEDMTDYEKIMTVHDYMVLNYEYDYSHSNYDISIMTTKTGVCMAYAFAFKHLMNELGIECLYVSSNEMDHGWNIVKLDDKWYHIDLTWDDPGNAYGQVRHTYALLSDNKIQNMEEPHTGYNLNGLSANSEEYDDADWRGGVGAIVTVSGVHYYIKGNEIYDENGVSIGIYLDGSDNKWSIGDNYVIKNVVLAGLAEYNGLLFFNTDKMIVAYSPLKKQFMRVSNVEGACGLYVDKNTLNYSIRDRENKVFAEGGHILLGTMRLGGVFHEDGKVIRRIYREDNADTLCAYAASEGDIQMRKIEEPGLIQLVFDANKNQTLYYWNDKMQPIKNKEYYEN